MYQAFSGGGNALAQKYVETPIANLQTGDIVVIVDKTSKYALPNEITNKAPIGTTVTLNSDQSQIESTISSSLKWEVEVTTNESVTAYKFKISDSENYLYVKNSNDGVRIGDSKTSTDNSFIWDKGNNKLQSSTLTRWIGVYTTNPDWRCYNTATQTNIKNTVTAFYKLVDTGKTPADIEYETTEYTALLGQAFKTPILTNPNNLTPTYSIECTPAGVAEINETTGDVTIKAAGKAVVTATTEEDDTYDRGQASYTITIKDPNDRFTLVTEATTLKAGDILIITNGNSGEVKAMKAYDGSAKNCKTETVTLEEDGSIYSPSENIARLTLGGETGKWTIHDGNYYLYAAGGATGSNNYLMGRTELGTDDNDKATISITEGTAATIIFNGDAVKKIIRYNNSSDIFSCYSSGQADIYIYRKTGSLTIGEEKYATFYSDQAYVMPEGVTGGIITTADKTEGTLTVDYRYAAGSTVPTKTALLVKGEAKTYTFDYSASTEDAPAGNLLHGANAVDASGNTYVDGTNVKYYILSHNQSGTDFGFYWATDEGAAVAYQAPYAFLAIDFGNSAQPAPKLFSLDGGEGTTGINVIENADKVADGKIYTVTGAYISKDHSNLPKGIYIVNGKKIAVK